MATFYASTNFIQNQSAPVLTEALRQANDRLASASACSIEQTKYIGKECNSLAEVDGTEPIEEQLLSTPHLVLRNLLLRGSHNFFCAESKFLQKLLKRC